MTTKLPCWTTVKCSKWNIFWKSKNFEVYLVYVLVSFWNASRMITLVALNRLLTTISTRAYLWSIVFSKNTELIIGEKLLLLQNFIFDPFLYTVVTACKTVTFNDRWILGPSSFQSSNGEVWRQVPYVFKLWCIWAVLKSKAKIRYKSMV